MWKNLFKTTAPQWTSISLSPLQASLLFSQWKLFLCPFCPDSALVSTRFHSSPVCVFLCGLKASFCILFPHYKNNSNKKCKLDNHKILYYLSGWSRYFAGRLYHIHFFFVHKHTFLLKILKIMRILRSIQNVDKIVATFFKNYKLIFSSQNNDLI